MIQIISNKNWHGTIQAKASKSHAHRLLICAALGKEPVRLRCSGFSEDIEATIRCLRAMGAEILIRGDEIDVTPIKMPPEGLCSLSCGESGSTLRFLLPVVGALGLSAVFHLAGRLPERPLKPLEEQLVSHGMALTRRDSYIHVSGKLQAGEYFLPGNVSSQYTSGLLMALPLLRGESTLAIDGKQESAAYVDITRDVLRICGVEIEETGGSYHISGGQKFCPPEKIAAEGDWSNGAFWLCAGALLPDGLCVAGLNPDSCQGDKEILSVLRRFGARVDVSAEKVTVRTGVLKGIEVDASGIPDLVPIISVVAAGAQGESRIVNAARLRLKESDRLKSTADMLCRLGADVVETETGLVIRGGKALAGGRVSSWSDHRIAMAAAVASLLCQGEVTIEGSEAVSKSYPAFWEDLRSLTGKENDA